jgi:hypothetical protein
LPAVCKKPLSYLGLKYTICNLYLVVAFDVTKENDENLFSKTKSSELEVNWTLKDYQNVNYYMYAVVESQRIANMNIIDEKIYLEMK